MTVNKYIFTSFPLWYSIILLFKNKLNFEHILTLNSSIHALISSICSITYLYSYISLDTYKNTLGFSITYILYDVINLIKKKDYQLLLHHIVMLISLSPLISNKISSLILVNNYYVYISKFFLSEITTIFLNISWILYKIKKTNTKLFRINTYILLVLTFLIRVCYVTYLNREIYLDNINNFLILTIPLTLLNYYWFYRLCIKALSFNS